VVVTVDRPTDVAAVVRSILLAIFGALLVLLLATGVYLWFRYEPSAAQAIGNPDGQLDESTSPIRLVHRFTSIALIPVAVAFLALGLVAESTRARRSAHWVGPLAAVVLVLSGTFTGYLLPWDQLALWDVSVGTDARGVALVFSGEVRFVLIDGVEIGTGTYKAWAVVHAVAVPVALLGALASGPIRSLRARHP